jgi:GNAT superfamily N-acetyltransferase
VEIGAFEAGVHGMSSIDRHVVRQMVPADLPAVQALLKQLGTDIDLSELERRFASTTDAADHEILVGTNNDSVVGLLHMYARPALEKPPEAIVQALVVDSAHRGTGIGRILMDAAEHWTRERGFESIALSSHVSREAAHAFYTALGYQVIARSILLRKTFEQRENHGAAGF